MCSLLKLSKKNFLLNKYDAYYFYKAEGPTLTWFDILRSEEVDSMLSKFIYINQYLYYIIYKDAHFVDVYTLNSRMDKHYIEYRLGKL